MPHLAGPALTVWHLIRDHNVMGLTFLIFLEELGVPLPLPGNILLMGLGMSVARGRVDAAQVITAMTLASIAGSIGLYIIAMQVGRRAVLRWGRYIGLDHKRVERIEAWLGRYGAVTIFLGRCTPGLRTPTSAVGGIFGVPLPLFIPFSSLAAFLWTAFWIELGTTLGRNARLERYMSGQHFTVTLLLAGACLLILPAIGFINARRQRAAERRQQSTAANGQPTANEASCTLIERVEREPATPAARATSARLPSPAGRPPLKERAE